MSLPFPPAILFQLGELVPFTTQKIFLLFQLWGCVNESLVFVCVYFTLLSRSVVVCADVFIYVERKRYFHQRNKNTSV